MAKIEVKRRYPRAKLIQRDGICMVVAWDAFFAVGPLLGQGRTPDEAWNSVRLSPEVTPVVALAVLHAGQYFRGGRHRKFKGRKR